MANGEKEARKQRINRFFLSIYDNLPLLEQGDNNDRGKKFFLLIEFFLTILAPIDRYFDIFFTLLLFISLLYSTKIFHLKFDILPVFFFYNAIVGRFLPFLIPSPLSRLFNILPVPFLFFFTIDGLLLHTFLFLFYLKKSKTGTKKIKLYAIIFFFSAFLLGEFFSRYDNDGNSILFLLFLITSIYLIRKNIKAQPKYVISFILSLFYLCLIQFISPNNFYIFFRGLLSDLYVYIRSIITLVGLLILFISTILYIKVHDYQQNRKIVSIYFILYLITDLYFFMQVPMPVYNIVVYVLAVLVFYFSFLNNGIIGRILLYLSTSIPPFILYSHYTIRIYEVYFMLGNVLLKSVMIFLLIFFSNQYKRGGVQGEKKSCTDE
jgi:hypothetical protein